MFGGVAGADSGEISGEEWLSELLREGFREGLRKRFREKLREMWKGKLYKAFSGGLDEFGSVLIGKLFEEELEEVLKEKIGAESCGEFKEKFGEWVRGEYKALFAEVLQEVLQADKMILSREVERLKRR